MNRDEVQADLIEKALASRNENGEMRCTIEAITGLGKTFIAFHLIKILQPKTVLFLAETQLREQNIRDDIVQFKKFFDYDIEANHRIEFMCYQSSYKRYNMFHDMVVADGFVRSCLIDWNSLRASYTPCSSNDYIIVKEMKIGQSAAKCPEMDERSETISRKESRFTINNYIKIVYRKSSEMRFQCILYKVTVP